MCVSSIRRALATIASILDIFISRIPCASLAASYSAFSDKSPLSLASPICSEIDGRSTVLK